MITDVIFRYCGQISLIDAVTGGMWAAAEIRLLIVVAMVFFAKKGSPHMDALSWILSVSHASL